MSPAHAESTPLTPKLGFACLQGLGRAKLTQFRCQPSTPHGKREDPHLGSPWLSPPHLMLGQVHNSTCWGGNIGHFIGSIRSHSPSPGSTDTICLSSALCSRAGLLSVSQTKNHLNCLEESQGPAHIPAELGGLGERREAC